MPNADVALYRAYAQKRMLPTRRLEVQLAQVSLLIAKTMGGVTEAEISDFLFDPEDDTPPDPVQVFGFSPRNKKAT